MTAEIQSHACRWLRQNATAKYDVLAMASHNHTQQVQKACPHCVMVFGHDLEVTAGRYAALCQLIQTTQWQVQVTGKYEYIYFPEEEIVQTVESVNRYASKPRFLQLEILFHPILQQM